MFSQIMNSKCQILWNIVFPTWLVVNKITHIVKITIIHSHHDHLFDQMWWFHLPLNCFKIKVEGVVYKFGEEVELVANESQQKQVQVAANKLEPKVV